MTTRTTSKKVLQSFHARDTLWNAFVLQAEKLDCSVDFLVNEAMRVYAEAQGFAHLAAPSPQQTKIELQTPEESVDDVIAAIEPVEDSGDLPDLGEDDVLEEMDASADAPPMEDSGPGSLDELMDEDVGLPLDDGDDLPDLDDVLEETPQPKRPAAAAPAPPAPKPAVTAPTVPVRPPQPAPKPAAAVPAPPRAKAPVAPRPPKPIRTPSISQSGIRVPAAEPSHSGAIPRQSSVSVSVAQEPARPTLTLIFEGRKVPINKDQFIIGRGSKSTDLSIKDPNVSRKHAAIIYHNGAYYIKDLGSTNGVEYRGQLVDSKRIDEGDVFSICDHQFHFTYS